MIISPNASMRRTIRIGALAKEIQVRSIDLIKACNLAGLNVRSASSVVYIEPNQAILWETIRNQAENRYLNWLLSSFDRI